MEQVQDGISRALASSEMAVIPAQIEAALSGVNSNGFRTANDIRSVIQVSDDQDGPDPFDMSMLDMFPASLDVGISSEVSEIEETTVNDWKMSTTLDYRVEITKEEEVQRSEASMVIEKRTHIVVEYVKKVEYEIYQQTRTVPRYFRMSSVETYTNEITLCERYEEETDEPI